VRSFEPRHSRLRRISIAHATIGPGITNMASETESPVTTGEATRRMPETAAAVVNGVLVLFLPVILYALHSLFPDNTHSYAVGHAPGYSPWPSVAEAEAFIVYVCLMAPLVAVAAWRTFVHATRWREGERSLQGIAEAAACGFAVPMMMVVGLVRIGRALPLALGYSLFYGIIGLVIGFVVGILLQFTAMVVLMVTELVTD
jgi:hypothetical protein